MNVDLEWKTSWSEKAVEVAAAEAAVAQVRLFAEIHGIADG